MAVGHIRRGSRGTPGRASRSVAPSTAGAEMSAGSDEAAAVVATPAVGRVRVVELLAQEAQPAAVGVEVVAHRLLLVAAHLGHPGVALGVVDPRLAGGDPALAHPLGRAVDVEHLQHLSSRERDRSTWVSSAAVLIGCVVRARPARCAPAVRPGSRPRRSSPRSPGPPGPAAGSPARCRTPRPARPTCW